MVSNRKYKNSLYINDVLTEINKGLFGQYDPNVVFMFIKHITITMNGNKVLLSNDMEGKIILINLYDITKPCVQIEANIIDLAKESDLKLKVML